MALRFIEELSSKTAPAAQVNERLDFSGVICWRPSFRGGAAAPPYLPPARLTA